MENEMQMSPEEQEKLLAEDPTPEVPRTYTHSAAFRQKQNRYMRAYRTSKVEAQVKAEMKEQPPVFLELFQELFQEPDQPDIEENLEAQLYSALWMAELLNQPEPKESETY